MVPTLAKNARMEHPQFALIQVKPRPGPPVPSISWTQTLELGISPAALFLQWGCSVRAQKATMVGESAVILVPTMLPWTCTRRFPDASYWSIVNLPEYDVPSALTPMFWVM